jgi:hypothetical protein
MKRRRRDRDFERGMWRRVAGHFGMGAVLGAGFALIVLYKNSFGIAGAIAGSEAPTVVRIAFVAGVANAFAFCAAITGFLFLLAED